MSLPKISHPTFNVVIPSTNQKARLRPFLVREEKILLLAQTSEDPADISDAIRQVINNCLVDKIDVEELTTFDLEYMFLKLRAKSVGNQIELKYTDPEDGEIYDIPLNLDDVEVKRFPDHTTKIEISSTTGIILRYPRAEMAGVLKQAETEVDVLFATIKYCIDQIYDSEDVYNITNYSQQEIDEFVDNLSVETFRKIQNFFETMPRLYYEAKYKPKKGGKDKTLVLSTLTDFFTLR